MSETALSKTLPKKLLIVCFGAIGDVTRALPLLDRIKTADFISKKCKDGN